MSQHDDAIDLQTAVEGGRPYSCRDASGYDPHYGDQDLKSTDFEAAWGRVVRDVYTPGVDPIKAIYDACVIGWRAGFEYGQQS